MQESFFELPLSNSVLNDNKTNVNINKDEEIQAERLNVNLALQAFAAFSSDSSSPIARFSDSSKSLKDESFNAVSSIGGIPPLFKLNKNYDLVDALPYVDPLNEEAEEEIKALIEQEMNSILAENAGEMKNYLSTFPTIDTSVMENAETAIGKEIMRCASGKKMEKLDMTLYSSLDAPSQNNIHDICAWEKSVQNSYCLLEHSYTAIMNLELMLNFAKDAWLKHLARLELHEKAMSEEVYRSRQQCEDVNKRRKLEQMSCGNTLRSLQREKEDVMQKSSKILSALRDLEVEILELREKCIKKGVLPEEFSSKRKQLCNNGIQDDEHLESD